MTNTNYIFLMEKCDSTFSVNPFTAISYFYPGNWLNFFTNCFGSISFCPHFANSFLTPNIYGGIISDWSSSKGAVKSRIALSINGHRYPALLNFAVIALISLSKFDATFRNLYQFTEMVFRLYLFRILEIFDIVVLLLHLHCSRYFSVFTLVLGENHLKLQIIYLKIHDIWISWYNNILISGYSRQFIESAIRDFTTHTDENESFIIRRSMFVCTVLWIEQNCFETIYKETQLVTSE